MALGLTGCGGDEESAESSSTVSPRTPAGQGKEDGETADASGSEGSSTSGSSTSGEATGSADPSGSGSPAASSSGASTDAGGGSTDLPAEAKERTKEGAAAFGEYYYEQFGEAIHSGDVSTLDALSAEDCPPCNEAAKQISADHDKGLGADRNPYTQSDVKAQKRPDVGYKVTMNVDVAEYQMVKDGKAVGQVDARTYQLTEHVVWTDDRWVMSDWSLS